MLTSNREVYGVIIKRTRELLKSESVTQTMLAEWLGVTEQTICSIMRRRHKPEWWFILGIADIFRISLDELCRPEVANGEDVK